MLGPVTMSKILPLSMNAFANSFADPTMTKQSCPEITYPFGINQPGSDVQGLPLEFATHTPPIVVDEDGHHHRR